MPLNHRSILSVEYTFFMVALVCAMGGGLLAEDAPPEAPLHEQLERVVRDHIMDGFDRSHLAGEVVAIHLPSNITGEEAVIGIRPLRTFVPDRAAARYVIPLEITPQSGTPTRINVTVECLALIEGWVARFPMKRGTQIEAENYQRKKVRISHRENDYFSAEALPEGFQLSASLSQGQLLQFHHMEKVPVVQSGEQVMIHFRRRGLTLISPGKTRREGNIGELIPVITTTTGKRLYGRLESPGIVVVE